MITICTYGHLHLWCLWIQDREIPVSSTWTGYRYNILGKDSNMYLPAHPGEFWYQKVKDIVKLLVHDCTLPRSIVVANVVFVVPRKLRLNHMSI